MRVFKKLKSKSIVFPLLVLYMDFYNFFLPKKFVYDIVHTSLKMNFLIFFAQIAINSF
jgi:hypothetical protein